MPLHSLDELRDLVEDSLAELSLSGDLGGLEQALRYTLESGGKRIRPVLCLAVADAARGAVESALTAAVALELTHTFSLVHDDLPGLDDDDLRRGRPSAHVEFGEGIAVLAGDALLAEAFRLVASDERPEPARELSAAVLGMIGGQYRDITGDDADLEALHRLKTGRLLASAVGLGLWAADVPVEEQGPWRAFADELGLLFQVVDDLLDGDGYVVRIGTEGARELADTAAERARSRLDELDADTSVLRELVDQLAVRTS
jgi:geranylgeranyl diphosphate synthase, type II